MICDVLLLASLVCFSCNIKRYYFYGCFSFFSKIIFLDMDHVAWNAEVATPTRNHRCAGELLGAADEEPWMRDFGARR
jgi:hypothetical protein